MSARPPRSGLREIRVPRREVEEPRAQFVEAGHDPAGLRRQVAPVLALTAELGGDERAAEGRLGALDAAPGVPVAPAQLRGRVLDRAGAVDGLEDGDEPGAEPEPVFGLHPDLDPGSEAGSSLLRGCLGT